MPTSTPDQPPVTDDVRGGVPSASKLARVIKCPGSENLIKSIPAAQLAQVRSAEDDELATRGTGIHKAREILNDIHLADPEDRELFRKGLEFERELIGAWMRDKGIRKSDVREGKREDRLWLNDEETMRPVASGQLDVHYLAPPHALIIDWKALWATHVPRTKESAQLRLQALLLYTNSEDIKDIRTAYDKPMVYKGGTDDFTDYAEQDLIFSRHMINYQLWLSKQDDAGRSPSEECRYCPGKAWCVEGGAWALLPSVEQDPGGGVRTIANPVERVRTLQPVDLVKLWRVQSLVKKVLEEAQARLKGFSDDQLLALGLERTKGRRLDPIVNVTGVFEFLKGKGWTQEEILACVSFSKGDIADAIVRREGIAEKYASKRVAEDLKEFIEPKEAEQGLRMVKGI